MGSLGNMPFKKVSVAIEPCESHFEEFGFVPLRLLFQAAINLCNSQGHPANEAIPEMARELCRAFNGGAVSQKAMTEIARHKQSAMAKDAANTLAWMLIHDNTLPIPEQLSEKMGRSLERDLLADSAAYMAQNDYPYPINTAYQNLGFPMPWVNQRLVRSEERFAQFANERRSDTAVLVGNGPSLNETDLDVLHGQDVYISNYAMRHRDLSATARGVAVSNMLVAEQAPHLFQLSSHWKFHPVWLGHLLGDSDKTIWLNALGGSMFFSKDIQSKVAWHATVSFFWLQILFSAGYRKVVLIGVDNSYRQESDLKEGELVHQTSPDLNHFDPKYFQGKTWQAADTHHMQQTFELAKLHYEQDKREIVNCTVGGALEVFRRADLKTELQDA